MARACTEPLFGRMLEIGEHCLIGRALPGRTDYVCTSILHDPPQLPAELRRVDPLAAIRALRAGTYGLVIAHAPAYALRQVPILRSLLRRPLRRGPALLLRSLVSRLVLPHVPVIMLDLEDAPIIHPTNLLLLDRALLCFKRELPADHARAFLRTRAPALPTPQARTTAPLSGRMAKLRPISIGLAANVLAATPPRPPARTADVFFAGEIEGRSTLRVAGIAELKGLVRHGVRIDFAEDRLALGEFLRRAAAARMVWSPEGLAHDCFRHYEAAACWSVPVINPPGIERHRPLLDGVHALYYAVEPGGLTRTIRQALREPDRLAVMGRAGRRHVLRYHTYAALADYVLAETAAALDSARRASLTSTMG